jgi:hypothetical protein
MTTNRNRVGFGSVLGIAISVAIFVPIVAAVGGFAIAVALSTVGWIWFGVEPGEVTPAISYISAALAVIGSLLFGVWSVRKMYRDADVEANRPPLSASEVERRERELLEERREAEKAKWRFQCPSCMMRIHRDTRICPYCRTHFE